MSTAELWKLDDERLIEACAHLRVATDHIARISDSETYETTLSAWSALRSEIIDRGRHTALIERVEQLETGWNSPSAPA